jgi:hypothetical protein
MLRRGLRVLIVELVLGLALLLISGWEGSSMHGSYGPSGLFSVFLREDRIDLA